MIKDEVKSLLKDKGYEGKIDHPSIEKFGDFALRGDIDLEAEGKLIEKVEKVAGFTNIFIKKEKLVEEAKKIGDETEFKKELGKHMGGKKYLLEHTSPEPTKTLHIGHFRNNFLGIAIHNIFEALGAQVTLDCIDNDRGMKICKTMWGYLAFGDKERIKILGIEDYQNKLRDYKLSDEEITKISAINWQEKLTEWLDDRSKWFVPSDFNLTSDKFDNILYSPSHRAGELSEKIATDFQNILLAWESEKSDVREVWKQIIDWSHEGYERTYKRIGSFHDRVWHESDFYKLGKDWVDKGLEKGVFKKLPDGAILTNLEKFGMTDTIVMKRDGTSMYMTQDLQLTSQKVNTYPSDLYIWDIGNDQSLYLQQMFTVCDQLKIVSKEKLFHLNYGFITLKGKGKMGSRFGGVINGDDLLDELREGVKKIMSKAVEEKITAAKDIEDASEKIAVGACKFGFLKYDREKDIAFDIDQSLSLEGNSGPYLQYTYARCMSVLNKSQKKAVINNGEKWEIEEENLLREFYKFEEKIIEASERFSPAVIAEYLLGLARKYNEFYGKYRVIGEETEEQRLF